MNTAFVARHVAQYTVGYAGVTVGLAFVVGGPAFALVAAGVGCLLLLFLLAGEGAAHAHAEDPASHGVALGAGDGDHASLADAVTLGGAGRLYYAFGLVLFGVVAVVVRL